MRRWAKLCGVPVVTAVVGFLLLVLVEHIEYGTFFERYRLDFLYASQGSFLFGLAWALHGLWGLIKEYSALPKE